MRKGYTLIEVLVVIGIIAVLAAIIFPTYPRVQERARRAHCYSNLYQLGLAMKRYEMDCEGYPFSSRLRVSEWVGYEGTDSGEGLMKIPHPVPETGVLWTYIRDKRIYHCPSSEGDGVTYAVNYLLTLGARVEYPSETGMFADMADGVRFSTGAYGKMVRHSGGYNACYVDGHVKYRKYPSDLTKDSHVFFTGGDPRWEPPH